MKQIITKILAWEARYVAMRFKPHVIGITGSVGKSSTKEAIAAVLESKFSVRRNKKSYNSELGLALGILGLSTAWQSKMGWVRNILLGLQELRSKTFPEFLVLEMGIDRPKDMDALLDIVRPEIGVVTAIGEIPAHIEFFSGAEEVAREKSKLVKSLSAHGYAILNFDDLVVADMKEKISARILTYGFGEGADMRTSNYKISPEGISFKVDFKGASVPVRLPGVFGKHHVYPALAAMLVGSLFDMHVIEMSEALYRYKSPPGRMKLIEGVKNSKILDDSYNASPLATHAALDTLSELEAKRKIIAFGDMLEIGKHTIGAHQALGARMAQVSDYLLTVGPRSKFAADEAIASGMDKKHVMNFSDSKEAAQVLKQLIAEGDLVLIKGSQGMRMERVVEEIMAHHEDASKFLCRQDTYWRSKA